MTNFKCGDSRMIPLPNKRVVRKEACFGCAVCGKPIIEYHHIVPFHVSHDHSPTNLIVLCPTEHARADAGEFSQEYLRGLKQEAFNSQKDKLKYGFHIEGKKLIVKTGSNTFVNVPKILSVDGRVLVSLCNTDNFILLSADFFDQENRLIVSILENEWEVSVPSVWDVEYRPVNLKVRLAARDIFWN